MPAAVLAPSHFLFNRRIVNMKVLLVLALIGAIAAAPAQKDLKLPTFVKTCYRDQQDVNDCIKNSLQELFPILARGVRAMDLPPLDPLPVEEGIYEFENGLFSSKSIIKDAYAYGLGSAQFKSVRTNFENPDNIQIDFDFSIPIGRVEGTFKQQGQALGAPFSGRGNFNITGVEMDVTFAIQGALVTKNNKQYLNVKHFIVTPVSKDMIIDADNIFEGNDAMTKAILAFTNQYWKVLYTEALPFAQEGWDKVFRPVLNRFFLRVPFNTIFPSSQ